jgi:hypothetical protein
MNGADLRMRRLFRRDSGRAYVVAIDHGMLLGVQEGRRVFGEGNSLSGLAGQAEWVSKSAHLSSPGVGTCPCPPRALREGVRRARAVSSGP